MLNGERLSWGVNVIEVKTSVCTVICWLLEGLVFTKVIRLWLTSRTLTCCFDIRVFCVGFLQPQWYTAGCHLCDERTSISGTKYIISYSTILKIKFLEVIYFITESLHLFPISQHLLLDTMLNLENTILNEWADAGQILHDVMYVT